MTRRERDFSRTDAGRRRASSVVSPCRCAGACRCGGQVQALLLLRIERECEFYRRVM